MEVAGLHIGWWYDIFLKGNIRNYLGLARKSRRLRSRAQKLVIGPWVHGQDFGYGVGEWDAGIQSQGSSVGIEEMQFKWFDYWLKGKRNGALDDPPILIYVMGENRWRTEQEWPLARTVYTEYYLRSADGANSLRGDGRLDNQIPGTEAPDNYRYDPLDSVPTRGGATTGAYPAALPDGVYDQREIENRKDVLVYTSQTHSTTRYGSHWSRDTSPACQQFGCRH